MSQSSIPNAFTIFIRTKHLNALVMTAVVKNAILAARSWDPRPGADEAMRLTLRNPKPQVGTLESDGSQNDRRLPNDDGRQIGEFRPVCRYVLLGQAAGRGKP